MLIQQLVNGILASGIYALFAVGFAMVFGIMNVLNMAHADFAMIAALGAVVATATFGEPISALIAAMIGTVLVAILVARFAISPGLKATGDAAIEMPLIATIGAGMILQNVASLSVGTRPVVFPYWLPGYFDVFGIRVAKGLLISAVVATVLLGVLEYVMTRTDFGRQARAVAQNRNSALIMGINADRVLLMIIVITSSMSGVAGWLVGVSYGFVSPITGIAFAIKGLIAMIIGGVGSLRGALLGAVLLGVVESMAIMWLGGQLRDFAVFVVLILVLLVRPNGIISVAGTR